MSSEQPRVSSAAPRKSIVCSRCTTFSWKLRTSIHTASAPTGTLTKKIQRHEPYWANSPPRVGPSTDETPHTLAM